MIVRKWCTACKLNVQELGDLRNESNIFLVDLGINYKRTVDGWYLDQQKNIRFISYLIFTAFQGNNHLYKQIF